MYGWFPAFSLCLPLPVSIPICKFLVSSCSFLFFSGCKIPLLIGSSLFNWLLFSCQLWFWCFRERWASAGPSIPLSCPEPRGCLSFGCLLPLLCVCWLLAPWYGGCRCGGPHPLLIGWRHGVTGAHPVGYAAGVVGHVLPAQQGWCLAPPCRFPSCGSSLHTPGTAGTAVGAHSWPMCAPQVGGAVFDPHLWISQWQRGPVQSQDSRGSTWHPLVGSLQQQWPLHPLVNREWLVPLLCPEFNSFWVLTNVALLIQSSVDGELSCFQLFYIVNNAA